MTTYLPFLVEFYLLMLHLVPIAEEAPNDGYKRT